VIVQVVTGSAPGSIVCLTGLGGGQQDVSFDVAKLNQSMVLENRVVFGTVNANLRHYHAAADALAHASRAWLDAVITRRVGLARWKEAYEKRKGDVKTVLLFED
jgi:threonine dehydrogenase-like Zn-dependent dehydrogenase